MLGFGRKVRALRDGHSPYHAPTQGVAPCRSRTWCVSAIHAHGVQRSCCTHAWQCQTWSPAASAVCGSKVRGRRSLPQVLCSALAPGHGHVQEEQTLYVYAISDLHADHDLNMEWLRTRMVRGAWPPLSVLVVAGDVSDSLGVLREVLTLLKQAFWQVVFTPGNHELWVKGPASVRHSSDDSDDEVDTSIDKLDAIRRLCAELGVHMGPVRVGHLVLVPLLSWHHQSWDQEPDIPGNLVPRASAMTISDYARCIWPGGGGLGSIQVAELLDSMNDSNSNSDSRALSLLEQLQQIPPSPGGTGAHRTMGTTGEGENRQGLGMEVNQGGESGDDHPLVPPNPLLAPGSNVRSRTQGKGRRRPDVISLSHFLPSQTLLPEKRFLMFPNLAKAVGSVVLEERLKRLRPAVHVFGHTHFAWDAELSPDMGGVRCVQAPLCYPAERRKRLQSIIMHSDWQPPPPHTPNDGTAHLPLIIAKAHFTLDTLAPGSPSPGPGSWTQGEGELGHAEMETDMLIDQIEQALPCLLIEEYQKNGFLAISAGHTQPTQPALTAMHSQQTETAVSVGSWRFETCPELDAMWSSYYKTHTRSPEDVRLAPWVAPRYARIRARRGPSPGDARSQQGEGGLDIGPDPFPSDVDSGAETEAEGEERGRTQGARTAAAVVAGVADRTSTT